MGKGDKIFLKAKKRHRKNKRSCAACRTVWMTDASALRKGSFLMKRFNRILALMLAAMLFCSASLAETGPSSGEIQTINGKEVKVFMQNGRVTFVDGSCASEPIRSVEDASRVIASVIGLLGGDENTRFEPWRTLNDPFGNVYYVYQQTYADMIVLGGAVKVITDKDGNMLGLTSSVVSELPDTVEYENQISAEEAEALVIDHEMKVSLTAPTVMEGMTRKTVLPVDREIDVYAEKIETRFVWAVYTANPTASVSASTDLPYLAHYVTMAGEYLYNLPTILPDDAVAKAGYSAEYVFQFMEPVEYTGYVDLVDGSEQEISVTLMRDTRTGMYYLGNIERKIVVADCWEFLYNHGTVKLEYSPDNLEWDQVGLKSLYNYCRAYDYYRDIGWLSGDGEETPIIILKDYCDKDHNPIDNASYAGKIYGWQMFLSSAINHFSECLDVIAHEFTHSVTGSVMTHNAYQNDFGAINEAMSDIQGNICEMLTGATQDETWLLGESAKAVRSMSDPHRYGQPEYSWDYYYKANVKTPTDINDRGGVHTNSSLLNHLAYLLCVKGGMTFEEARAFWFAVDCAMVPGSDYPQLRALLPWVLKIAGLDAYGDELTEAIDATRLGDDTLPKTLADDQALLTLNLPDTEAFNNGDWTLTVVSVNVEKIEAFAMDFIEKIQKGDTDDLPKMLQNLLSAFGLRPTPEPTQAPENMEKKGFWASLLDAVGEALEKIEEEEKPKTTPAPDPDLAELGRWLGDIVRELFYSDNGSAGQDGHTISMVTRPGRTVPVLLYMVFEPNSVVMKQLNVVIYLNKQWVDVTDLLDSTFNGEEEETPEELVLEVLENKFSQDLMEIIETSSSVKDYLDAFTIDVKGGDKMEIPNTGLESIDLSANMAFKNDQVNQVVNTKSRPKLPTGEDLIQEMVVNYGAYGEEAQARNDKLLMDLAALDADAAAKWESIMGLWQSVQQDLSIHEGVLPDGLPDTDELCLVALGFQLNPDGTMKEELLERLRVLKASAEKYPNALIVCTGGGTASENETATEAGEMAKWLIENGVDEKRVIVENKSLTTAQNAIFTYDILTEQYPQVKRLAIVSSDYHIATGALLFGAEDTLRAETIGEEKMAVVSNAAYKAPSGSLSAMFQAGALIELSGDVETAFEIYYDTYDIHELPPIK